MTDEEKVIERVRGKMHDALSEVIDRAPDWTAEQIDAENNKIIDAVLSALSPKED